MKRTIGLLTLVFTLCLFLPAMATAADELPDGFIALSETGMAWVDAKAWCQQQGGKLPLVNGKTRIPASHGIPSGIPVDGFGFEGAEWPSGLPFGRYWLGTERNKALAPLEVALDKLLKVHP